MQSIQLMNFLADISQFPTSLVHTTSLPIPTRDQVLVRVHAVGCNFFDLLLVKGKYQFLPSMPFTPGAEFSGIVQQIGPDVTSVKVGDCVFGAVQVGAFASHVLTESRNVIPLPKSLTMEQAAGIYLTYPTAYAGLVIRAQLQCNETVLIHGGAGGVGLAAIQIAKMLGATVIATASSKTKLDIMLANGADHVIHHSDENWVNRVRTITKGKGVNVVFDPIGEIDKSLKIVAWNARLIVVGFAQLAPGKSESILTNRILLKNVSVMGLFWGEYSKNEPDVIPLVWRALIMGFNQGKLNPVVYPTKFHGLKAIKGALECLASRNSYGKVVVTVTNSIAKL